MAYAKKSLKVTKGIYDAAKLLIENGANNTEVAKYLKVSTDVVSFIRRSETYEEYQTIMYEYSLKMRQRAAAIKAKEEPKEEPKPETPPQIVEHRQTVTVQATWQMTQEMQKTNELLKQISNKLAYIVDELCGVKADAKPDH